jgi:hypothetical protein
MQKRLVAASLLVLSSYWAEAQHFSEWANRDDARALIYACGLPSSDLLETVNQGTVSNPVYYWQRKLIYANRHVEVWFLGPNKSGPIWDYTSAFRTEGDDTLGPAQIKRYLPCGATTLAMRDASISVPASQRVRIADTEASTAAYATPGSAPNGEAVGTLIIFFFCLLVYFVPVAVATHRKCKASGGVFVLNLFLGWTIIGWVVALAWAAGGEVNTPQPVRSA